MSLLCHLFGHKRSGSRAAFDDLHQCWVSDCKRCFTVLIREGPRNWNEAPVESAPLVHAEDRALHSVGFTIFAH
jgi:Prophage protein (DUF1660)